MKKHDFELCSALYGNIKCINIKLALFHKNPWHCKSFGPCFTYLFVCGFLFSRDDNVERTLLHFTSCPVLHAIRLSYFLYP